MMIISQNIRVRMIHITTTMITNWHQIPGHYSGRQTPLTKVKATIKSMILKKRLRTMKMKTTTLRSKEMIGIQRITFMMTRIRMSIDRIKVSRSLRKTRWKK
jgi:hypothetical protein